MADIVNSIKNQVSFTYNEVKADFARLKTGLDTEITSRSKTKVRALAAAKLAARAGVVVGAVLAISAVSSLLGGAVLWGSIKVTAAAFTIILSQDLYTAFRYERISNVARTKYPAIFAAETLKQRGDYIAKDIIIRTWLKPVWTKLTPYFLSKFAS